MSYWVDVKEHILGVDAELIEEHGVVSVETAEAMAAGRAQYARMRLRCGHHRHRRSDRGGTRKARRDRLLRHRDTQRMHELYDARG